MPLPQITLDGRVVGDIMFKFLDNGTALARFRIVCADRRKDEAGKWFDAETFWVTVSAFGRLAENIADSLHDRDQVIVTGKISTAEWTDQAGAKRTSTKVVATSVGPSLFFVPRTGGEAPSSTRPVGHNPDNTHDNLTPVSGRDTRVMTPPAGDDPWGY